MSTWTTEKAKDAACPQCGSTYEVTYTQVPLKDIDSANCVVCNFELDKWNSTRYPTYKPKLLSTWPKDEATNQ